MRFDAAPNSEASSFSPPNVYYVLVFPSDVVVKYKILNLIGHRHFVSLALLIMELTDDL